MQGRRWIILVVLSFALAACSDNTVGTVTATAQPSPSESATPTATPTPTATVSPSPSPTPEPEAQAPEMAFNQLGSTLMVRIDNPNEGIGLIRAGFELTLLAEDGAIIEVVGAQGLPGAACCTIYQLPPGGSFGLSYPMNPNGPRVHSVELVVVDEWVDWDTVDVPAVELSNVSVQSDDFSGPRVTGRAAVPSAAAKGPFNVWVVGFTDSPSGFIVAASAVECVRTPDPRAFDVNAFAFNAQGPYELIDVVAYTTTVPGVTQPAPGC